MNEFTPNTETMVKILTQRLVESELKSAQWQSIANELANENDQYKKRYESEPEPDNDVIETHEFPRE